jgi:hypothetical protein
MRLAQYQVQKERRGHPLVSASSGGPERSNQVVDHLGGDACLDGALLRRREGARVDLEAYSWVLDAEEAVCLGDVQSRLAGGSR